MELLSLGSLDDARLVVTVSDERCEVRAMSAFARELLGLNDDDDYRAWVDTVDWQAVFPRGQVEQWMHLSSDGIWYGPIQLPRADGVVVSALAAMVRYTAPQGVFFLTVAHLAVAGSGPVDVVELDASGKVVAVGEVACTLLGRAASDLLGTAFADLVADFSPTRPAQAVRVQRPDASVRFIDIASEQNGPLVDVQVTDATPVVVGPVLDAALLELHKRVLAGNDLDSTLDQLARTFADALGVPVVVTTSTRGRIDSVSSAGPPANPAPAPGATDRLGLPDWLDFRVPVATEAEAVLALGISFADQYVHRVASDGARLAAIAVGRAMVTDAMVDGEARFDELFGTVREISLLLDSSGRFSFVSPTITEVLGWSSAQLIGRHGTYLLHPDDHVVADKVVSELWTPEGSSSGSTVAHIVRTRHADGTYRWMETSITDRRDDPRISGFAVRAREVSGDSVAEVHEARLRLREARDRLRANVALQMAIVERERTALSRRIHEDPLQWVAAAMWRLDELEDTVGAETLAPVRDALAAAMDSAQGLMFELRPAALDELGLASAIGAELARKGAPLSWVVEVIDRTGGARWPRHVEVIAFRTVQEVLRSVVEHAHASGVTVEIASDGPGRAERLEVRVHDDGLGVPDATFGASVEGPLGVSTMQETIEILGGSLRVDARESGGTTVSFSIPALDVDKH